MADKNKRPDRSNPPAAADPSTRSRGGPRGGASFPIVGIGASAGGLEAFTQLLANLPLDTGMGFVLVQHLDPEHESALTQLLARATSLPVREVTNNLRVRANHVYVIPPNTNLGIVRGVLKLRPRQKTRAPQRSIDCFFEALAGDQRECAVGVVLSGTASDGTLGLEAIKAEGGITFAQDESARYDSMPRSAIAAGCVDFVLSPQQIAKELARIAKHPYVSRTALELLVPAEDKRGSAQQGGASDGMQTILPLLRNHSGVDFSLYKPSTIERRIARRMVLNKQDTLGAYAQLLQGNSKELDDLYADMLISVTSFFRNPEAFDALQRTVLCKLLEQRGDEAIRVWVLGCSTGQEAYSIAMAFVEAADKAPRMHRLQMFATDLNDILLDKARHGLYPKSIERELSPERLRRFFVEEEGGYRVGKALRETIVFARQNLLGDPPFSRIDLISCRNLLIYLEPSLQRKVLPVFHYALKPDGFLLLGQSESVGGFTELFEPVDKKYKIYSKKAAPTPAVQLPLRHGERSSPGHSRRAGGPLRRETEQGEVGTAVHPELNAQREADRVTAKHFAPPGVLVNDQLQILQFRGSTGAYLEPSTGKASFDVLKMARPGLMLPLRAALQKAKRENRPARRENVEIEEDGKARTVNVEVLPLKNLRERCFLVLFEDARKAKRDAPAPAGAGRSRRDGASRRVAELEAELGETRDYLQTMQEQYEAANEELQAANEEVQSANEELQSINEELETSKEELESGNEELTTVNEELANRNAELGRLNNDLVNVQTSAHLAIILLARDLTIRRFSAEAARQFNLLPADLGRPIVSLRHDLDLPDLGSVVTEVIDTVHASEHEVRDQHGRWFSLHVHPYLTLDKKVDGAVLVLVDVDDLKRSEQATAAARDYAVATVEAVREPLLLLDSELRVEDANRSFYRAFRVAPTETLGRFVYELGDRQWDIPELRSVLAEILPERRTLEDFQVEHDFEQLGRRTMLLNARPVHDPEHATQRILLAIEDITERKRSEDLLAEADRRKTEFLAMLAHELRNPLAPIQNALEIVRRVGGGEPSSPPVESAVEMMERQVGQMVRLVDDLLDVDRITRGKIELRKERVELSSVVHHVVEAIRPLSECMGHELTVTLPPKPVYVNADPTRLTQIVGNLLSNACKFADRGGRVWLTVEGDAPDVVIRVRDRGIGIAADQLPRIFEMFGQVDSSLERSESGLGIGLTLVKKLAELHGGTVEAHSAGLGQGSEFVVSLPIVVEAPEPPTGPTSREPTATAARRILVVDDNRDAAESLAMLLQLSGHETHTAHDGLQAVEMAVSFRPDVILLDIGLPKLNGYEAARRIREQRRDPGLVLVALTGWGQDQDRRRSKEAGIDAHLVKPVDYGAIVTLLAQLPVNRGSVGG